MKTKHLSRAGGADVNLTIHLTQDQLRVLRLLEEGLRSKEIAEKTGLKTSAISRIRSHLLSTFNATTTTALVKKARAAGVFSPRTNIVSITSAMPSAPGGSINAFV